MRKKASIKKILERGNLSGLEAGRLLIEDSWEVDHGREGFLSQEDIKALKAGLTSPPDTQGFVRMMETYRIYDYTLREANSSFLDILLQLQGLIFVLEAFRIESLFNELRGLKMPYIVSEKEYQAYKAEHQATLAKEFQPLQFVLSERISALDASISDECLEKTGEETWQDVSALKWVSVYHPETWKKAVQSISEKVEDGSLPPVFMHYEAKEATLEAFQSLQEWKLPAKKTKSLLEDGGFTGEQLLQAGFPEWRRQFEEFTPGHIDSLERNFGECFAILKHPPDFMLDEKGHSRVSQSLEWFRSLSTGYMTDNFEKLIQVFEPEEFPEVSPGVREGRCLKEISKERYQKTKKALGSWLAYYETSKMVSDYLKVSLIEDFEAWHENLSHQVALYNSTLEGTGLLTPIIYPEDFSLKPIHLEKVKPSKEMLIYLEERMALSLGSEWPEELAKRKKNHA